MMVVANLCNFSELGAWGLYSRTQSVLPVARVVCVTGHQVQSNRL